MTSRAPRRVIVAAALLGVGLALSACGGQEAGSAATLGDSRITEQQLTVQVQDVLRAQGLPVDTADASLTTQILSRMIVIDLVDVVAAEQGIEISQGRIDQQLAAYVEQSQGDQAAMEANFVQQGVAPSQIDGIIRLNLQAQDIGMKLLPNGTADEQGAAVVASIVALSDELDVTTSPRFGTWDAESLQLGPTPDDLSTPPSLEQ